MASNLCSQYEQAIETSPDQVLMTRLSNAISPGDAHATDVRYHKACWAHHVFNVLRDDTNQVTKSTKAVLPMQIPCLIKLINLIDF